jgi:hypothetical protein
MSRRKELLSRLQAEVDVIISRNCVRHVDVSCISGNRASIAKYNVSVRPYGSEFPQSNVFCDCPRDAFNVLKGINAAL